MTLRLPLSRHDSRYRATGPPCPATAASGWARTSGSRPIVSVIVPTLDEERSLESCLRSAATQEPPYELLVADGGSEDATLEIARAAGASVVSARRGRGVQMNEGARAAKGDILLFLHADTRLPCDALHKVRNAVEAGIQAGGFSMRYDSERPAFRFAAWLANLYCAVSRDLFGDRAMFVTEESFWRLGGFRELGLMEDLDLSARLRRGGYRTRLLPGPVVTSARRFTQIGIWRGGWWAWQLTRAYHRGADFDPAAARFYALRFR